MRNIVDVSDSSRGIREVTAAGRLVAKRERTSFGGREVFAAFFFLCSV